MSRSETLERLFDQLPDRHTAQLLLHNLKKHSSVERLFDRDAALLSDVLTLAAWSPLLAQTLENHPDYVAWLQRERADTHVRSAEELSESLSRFALINSQIDCHVMLARFRRRELLRIYLHDIRGTRTIVETTEELSNLADSVLAYALKLSRQELDNLYGVPQVIDEHNRIATAEFCVVALGKLGSGELNYASDIDLIFLFSENGLTAQGGSRGQFSNREYFVKLSERILRVISDPTGEGAAYRIDVRLRPHGRVGPLANSLREAANYYARDAQGWELQALIRSRPAAGSVELHGAFSRAVIDRVFRSEINIGEALARVRQAKDNIDVQRERDNNGYNVKLGRGGIREIEFIAQALQLAFGGGDPWLRTAHTLVTLGRLAERGLISREEHSQLSDAYHFLRALEHRLQMEHGLQTHSVPDAASKREVVARRMNCPGEHPLKQFDAALEQHTRNVRAAFDRIFGIDSHALSTTRAATVDETSAKTKDFQRTAQTLAKHLSGRMTANEMRELLAAVSQQSLNPRRALSFVSRIAASLDKENQPTALTENKIRSLVHLCGVSETFSELIASRPSLIDALPTETETFTARDYRAELAASIAPASSWADELSALRSAWTRLLLEIATRDAAGALTLPETNRLLTELAVAGIENGLTIAARQLKRRYPNASEAAVILLGLGRLASGGMDYGSDLDMVIVFDSTIPSPVPKLTSDEAYAKLAEYFVAALSSITREGFLYRVDLRLRPDGQKGPLATGSQAFKNYIETRAEIWEWLAYVKLRAIAGHANGGRDMERSVRTLIENRAQQTDASQLARETARVRDRLELERVSRTDGINIKHGAGGMLDVYFASRYLQLRDRVHDDEANRSTVRSLGLLREVGALDGATFKDLRDGYSFLRTVDHQARLIVGRSAALPPAQHPAFGDIARRVEIASADELSKELKARMSKIRRAYNKVMTAD